MVRPTDSVPPNPLCGKCLRPCKQAATVVLGATVATALLTYHRLGQLDLVAALKIKE